MRIETPQGDVFLSILCTGRKLCACDGAWYEVLAFLDGALGHSEDRKMRYFGTVADVRTVEERNKHSYLRTYGARTSDGHLVAVVQVCGSLCGHNPHDVELAYVTHPDWRRCGIASALTALVVSDLRRTYRGHNAHIMLLEENEGMLAIARSMYDNVQREGDGTLTGVIELREPSFEGHFADIAVAFLGFVGANTRVPLHRATTVLSRYAA